MSFFQVADRNRWKKRSTVNFSFTVLLPLSGDPAGARTQDPNIKSVVLYLLSYEISGRH